ncbi:unnamed protein product [Rhodiola kirilowii]
MSTLLLLSLVGLPPFGSVYGQVGLLVPNIVSKTVLWATVGFVMDNIQSKQYALQFKFQVLIKRKMSSSLAITNRSTRVYSLEERQSSHAAMPPCHRKANSYEGQTLSSKACSDDEEGEREEEDEDDDHDEDMDNDLAEFDAENHTEVLRRRRIGLANKGKIPWNKGITHNEVTRLKIKQRTIEALSNPKVRKKMSECYRDRSDQCKKKISVSLKHVWAKRLNYPRQREKFYLSWLQRIAIAAKKGGEDQKELEWDSYDKMLEDLVLQKHQQALDEAKEKVKVVLRGMINPKNKTERLSALAQNRSGRGMEDQHIKRVRRKKCVRMGNDEEILAPEELKLQTRLSKIQLKKPAAITIKAETHSSLAWEKFELDYVKREIRENVSLADQIRAAKNRRKS